MIIILLSQINYYKYCEYKWADLREQKCKFPLILFKCQSKLKISLNIIINFDKKKKF